MCFSSLTTGHHSHDWPWSWETWVLGTFSAHHSESSYWVEFHSDRSIWVWRKGPHADTLCSSMTPPLPLFPSCLPSEERHRQCLPLCLVSPWKYLSQSPSLLPDSPDSIFYIPPPLCKICVGWGYQIESEIPTGAGVSISKFLPNWKLKGETPSLV